MNATWKAYAESDLYSAGHSCDGYPFIAERFYVVIENARGKRFRHHANFNSAQRLVCDETGEPHFANLRDGASAKAERLAARVNAALVAGLALDSALWYEIDPAYGSDEYQSQGIEAQRAFADRAAI